MKNNSTAESSPSLDFIRKIVEEDIQNNKNDGRVHTRFPPEPNGYLHIGHAKAICLDFEVALENNGLGNLRFDDTNPIKEDAIYVESIKEDIRWLGYDWEDRLYYASDYFGQFFEYAVQLIKAGKAFVCDLSAEEIKESRGTLTEPGKESPYRNRTIAENLDLFQGMRKGDFEDGARVLRAKIDMASPNLNLRDPVMYRIIHASHHRTGDEWCIYPTYDWAHGLGDSIEGVTHSLCTLEFEDHRPLYDWYLEQLGVHHPQQIEFARLNITYTVLSKRKLIQLVEEGHVNGWDDPRMPTLAGMRRRGYPPEAIRTLVKRVGISKRETFIDISLLEACVREELDKQCSRVMAVLQPLRVVITNYPEDQEEELEAPNYPKNPNMGSRKVPFSRILYIEEEDFLEDPPKKFRRLAPGREVRLRYAYFIKCENVIKDDKSGQIIELHCTYDRETKGGQAPDGRKVKATIHWVSAAHAIKAEARLYDRLFTKENPLDTPDGSDFKDYLNPASLEAVTCYIEPSLAEAGPGTRYQFERLGYFVTDPIDSAPEKLVINRTITLRDTWKKMQKTQK
ncbi:MAG: glutamine--tRNA ligase/YqeY domain fusion protein [Candidatus Hodarchaeales archaeon]|jgi:glutaminyl-tRNA synthetase